MRKIFNEHILLNTVFIVGYNFLKIIFFDSHLLHDNFQKIIVINKI